MKCMSDTISAFFSQICEVSKLGDHPKDDDLAKFDYRLERKVKRLRN
jgi:hypothetical protein